MELLLTGHIPSKYICSDGGRSESKRPRQKNDCSVRALALACSVEYDTAYDYLHKNGRKCSSGFFLNRYLDKLKSTDTIFGHTITKLSFPAQKGKERMFVAAFPIFYPKGKFIIRQAGHLAAVIDGYVYDITFRSRKCVYCAWKFEKAF